MGWFNKYIKNLKKERSKIKIGPSFFVQGNKKMMIMTRPIDTYLFGLEQIIKSLEANINTTSSEAMYSNIFASTLNSLLSDILNYFQNRVIIKIGKEISITSIPGAKAQIKKYFRIDVKDLIGSDYYKELKGLDNIRGNFQHSNDRYFIDFKINNKNINSVKKLIDYCIKIEKIIKELDSKLESISPSYETTKTEKPGQIVIETKAINHSFDLNRLKVNKKKNKEFWGKGNSPL